jgi:hypothetical protein
VGVGGDDPMLRTFSFFITDRRYSAPTLQFLFCQDEARARELAHNQLLASEDHLAVEVHENGRPLFCEDRTHGAVGPSA